MNATLAEFVAAQRHKITLTEARAMQAAGVFGDRAFELIDGELIEMAAEGARTIDWNAAIARWLILALGAREEFVIVPDKTLILSETDCPKPDLYVFPAAIDTVERVRGPDVLLVIEVSDTTLATDLQVKAELYAMHGVREYWVIDCAGRRVFVHRLAPSGGYGARQSFSETETAAAALIRGLRLRLADLPRLP